MAITTQPIGKLGGGLVWQKFPGEDMNATRPMLLWANPTTTTVVYLTLSGQKTSAVIREPWFVALNAGDTVRRLPSYGTKMAYLD